MSLIIFYLTILAGVFGIFHDQITYSISPEYFTRFKYVQFGIDPYLFGGDRQTVAVIGFLATWWTGILIGLGLGITGLIFKDYRTMLIAVRKAVGLVFIVTIVTSFFGFLYGKLFLIKYGVEWRLPESLLDKDSFIIVGSIHNFSYFGGLLGLILGICYLIRQKRLCRTEIF